MLAIYETTSPTSAFSAGGLFTNPFSVAMDGSKGEIIQKKLYVRNDDALKTYTSISLQPVDTSNLHLVDGTKGFSWKLIASASQPLDAQWAITPHGNSITIPDILDTNTYEPFWVRIEIPRGTSVQAFDGVVLRITATEV